MKQFELLDKKQKIVIVAILVFIIGIIIFYFYTQYQEINFISNEVIQKEYEENSVTAENERESQVKEIVIHISGAVVKEGIIKINQGARISDVIEAAGGLLENASLKEVNLAYMVEDGQKIYIPTKEEEQQAEIEYTIIQEGNNNSIIDKKEEFNKVNINRATQTELEELPGIGSSTALKIIQYREENGKFESIEDIKNVNGIGDSKFNNIKEYISV